MPEPPYRVIRRALEQKKAVPFLGAGASRSVAGVEGSPAMPGAAELARWLAEETAFPSDNKCDRDDLAKVASYYVEVNSRDLLRSELRSRLATGVQPGALHRYLAGLPGAQLIISTNYDTLLEQALREAGKPYHLVVHPIEHEDLRGSVLWWPPGAEQPETPATNMLDIDLEQSTVVYKMHGSVSADPSGEWDNFVITEDDYTELLSQMSGGNSAIPAIFQEYFLGRYFLFLGYSLSDWNLRVVFNNLSRHLQAARKGAQFKAWAIQKQPSAFETQVWSRRGVTIFDQDIEQFVTRLRDAG